MSYLCGEEDTKLLRNLRKRAKTGKVTAVLKSQPTRLVCVSVSEDQRLRIIREFKERGEYNK